MSVTVHQSPEEVTPAYNDMNILATFSNYASANFKGIAVVKNGAGTEIARLKSPVLYSEQKVVFNISRILESYISYSFTRPVVVTLVQDGVLYEWEVEIGEEYGTPASGTFNIQSASGWASNQVFTGREFDDYDKNTWLSYNGNDAQFLSNRRVKPIADGQDDFLSFLIKPSPLTWFAEYVEFKSYTAGGTLLSTTSFNVPGGSIGEIYQCIIPSGFNVNDVDGSELYAGAQPAIHPSAAYYTIQVFDNSAVAATELYRYNITEWCSEYDLKHLWYLNRHGAMESQGFYLKREDAWTVERGMMKQQTRELLTSTRYGENTEKHAFKAFDTRSRQRVSLYTDWLTDAEAEYLKELVTSPVVFFEDDGYFIPVNIENQEYIQQNTTDNDTFFLKVDIVYSDFERSQRG